MCLQSGAARAIQSIICRNSLLHVEPFAAAPVAAATGKLLGQPLKYIAAEPCVGSPGAGRLGFSCCIHWYRIVPFIRAMGSALWAVGVGYALKQYPLFPDIGSSRLTALFCCALNACKRAGRVPGKR